MIAVITQPPGGWDATQVVEHPQPHRQAGQVLVAIKAVGLNPADAFQVEGSYPGGPKPPFIPGRDAAGVVVGGDEEQDFREGDSVVILQTTLTDLARGTLCSEQTFPPQNLAPLPEGWTPEEGAAAPLVYGTAYQGLFSRCRLQAGETVVVTGASGGVGIAAVQLASAAGATVIGLSRSAEKQRKLLGQGATHVLSPQDPELKKKIKELTGGRGVDVVLDTVGGSQLTDAIHWMGKNGRIGLVGILAGTDASVSIPSLMFKGTSIHGVLVSDDEPAVARQNWREIVRLLKQSGRRPQIDSTFDLADFRQAFERLRGDSFGKVVVRIPAEQPVELG